MRLTLETECLLLRPFQLEDAYDMFYGWANDPEVTKYLTWVTHQNVSNQSCCRSVRSHRMGTE